MRVNTDRLIDLVVRSAGLPTAGYSCTPLGPMLVNATYLIQFDGGDRYVVRIYRWPFDGPDDLDRAAKEMWLRVLRGVRLETRADRGWAL